jgi:acyl carrier protein
LEVIDDVRSIIAKALKIPADRLTPESRLDELGAESLDVIEIVYNLEEKFDIAIPFKAEEGSRVATQAANEANNDELPFSTVGDIANMVKHLVEAKAPR